MLTPPKIITKPKLSIPFSLFTYKSTLSDHLNFCDPPPVPQAAADYDARVAAAARAGDFVGVRNLLTKRINNGCFNTKRTFNFLTKTPHSLFLLDELFETLACLPKGFPRKCAFDCLIARLCTLQLTDRALQVFDEMRKRNFEFNVATFYPILSSLTKRKEIGKAWEVVELMKKSGTRADTTAYNHLLTGYCAAGDVKSAAEVLEKMREEGLEGDTRTYDAMVLGACRAGKVEAALALLRAVEEQDEVVPLLYSTYAHVVTTLVRTGFYGQAVKFVVGCYGGKDERLDDEIFGLLASRLVKLERVEEAMFVLYEMDKRGIHMSDKLRDIYQLHA